jgi:predicted permease
VSPPPRPPRLAELLVRLTAHEAQRDDQLGDLLEDFEERAAHRRAAARGWYWRQALGSAAANLGYRLHASRRNTTAHAKGDGAMGTLLQNIRHALRSARKNLGFSAVVVLTLGLGIGANTTIFSAVHGLILDPFPFPEPDRIVGIGTAYPKLGGEMAFWENLSPAEYEDVRDNSRTLEAVVAWDMGNRQISGEGTPQNVFTGFWWGDALRTLGMKAHLGRGFSDEEIESRAPVALLSYRIWRDRFGADSTMVGDKILMNDAPHTLVGILPEGVALYGMDLWTLMPIEPDRYPRNRRQFQLIARVRDGSTLRDVNTELDGLARRTEQAYGAEFEEYQGWTLRALTWNHVSSRPFRAGAFILMGAVGFVLLLVCANTANLLLARAQGRRREMAVRTAMGAGRGRLLGQLLTESLVLAFLGGAVGVGLARLGNAGVRALLTTLALPVAGEVELNGAVLGFTAVLAIAAGVVFGLVPAFHASRAEISSVLQAEGKGSTAGRSHQRLQRTLVGAEVALAFVLLAGGGLLVNSFMRLSRVDTGFASDHVLTMRLTLPREKYSGDAVPAFFQDLTERVEGIPGVRMAAAASQFPPLGFSFRELWFEGGAPSEDQTLPRALTTVVTAGYFETLGIPLRAGRPFDGRDAAGSPLVAVINEVAARRWFPDRDPVGARLKIGGPDADAPWFEIVGVVGATQNRGLDRPPEPEVFGLHAQLGDGANQLFLLARTNVEPRSVLPALRRAIQAMDPDQPVYAIQTVDEAFASGTATRRATTLFLTLFAFFALALAAVGIYAVVSFTVSERTQEIGLRVALGADAGGVRRLVVRQALVPVIVGAGVGLGLAVPVGGALKGMLFEVAAVDPTTMGIVALLLVGVAAAASWIPAWRASRLDPVEALRVE